MKRRFFTALLHVALRNILRKRQRHVSTSESFSVVAIYPKRCAHKLEVEDGSNDQRQSDRAAAKREHPLDERTRSAKHASPDHHAAFPTIELIERHYISDRQCEI